MNQADQRYHHFVQILREELVPAMGCTEPIAIAYGAAKCREVLGGLPDEVVVAASGSILLDVRMIEARAGDAMGLLTAGIILILLLLLHFIYVFPLEARYQNGLLAGLANARGIFIVHLKRSLALTGILLAEFLLVTQFNTPLRTFSILFLPILMIYTISKAVMPVFRKLEDKDGKK